MSALSAGTSYRAVLSLPRARRLFLSAAVGRLAYAVLPLGLFFTVRDASGSFGVAGLVLAAGNLTVVVAGPLRARIVDRYGRRRVLPVLALAYAAAIVALVAGATARVPVVVLLGLAALAGAVPPPLGPSMRGLWAELAPDPARRQRAYSLDAVVEEILFTAGPLITGLALAVARPWHAVAVALTLLLAGTFALVLSPGSGLSTPTAPEPPTGRRASLLRRPGFGAMLGTVAGVSTALGLAAVLVPVSATLAGHPAAAGPLEAVVAAGSAIGGLLYGRRTWGAPPSALLWRLCAALAAVSLLLAASPNLVVLGGGLALAGLSLSPTLIIGYTLADRLAPASARTEASSWVNTAGNAGAAAGTAAAGLLADHLPAWCLYLAVGAVPLIVATLATPKIARALAPAPSLSLPRNRRRSCDLVVAIATTTHQDLRCRLEGVSGTLEFGGRTVGRIGFGAMQLPGPGVFGPPRDRAEALAVVRRAVDLGVNHIDTAQYYGPDVANELLHAALYPFADDLALVSKVGARRDDRGGWLPAGRPEQLRAGVLDNLRTLGVEQLHAVNLRLLDAGHGEPGVAFDEQLDAMSALRDEGLIAGIGLSNATLDQLQYARSRTEIVCVQNAYNLADRSSESVLRACQEAGIAFVPFFPLGSAFGATSTVLGHPGVLAAAARLGATPAQIALAWVLAVAPNTLLIPGTASLTHLNENLDAGSVTLDDEALRALS